MAELLYIGVFFIILTGIFVLIEKPLYIGIIVVFLNLYRYNFPLPGPLDLRGLITLILFARIIFDKENLNNIKTYLLKDKRFWLLAIFILINFIVSYSYSMTFKESFKFFLTNMVTLLIGFYIITQEKGVLIFLIGFVLSGFMATLDIFYSRYAIGTLHVYRILDVFTGNKEFYNHNFFGIIIASSFIYTLSCSINRKISKVLATLLLLFFALGILLSTSRSSLIIVIIVSLTMLKIENIHIFNIKRLAFGLIIGLVFTASLWGGYSLLLKSNQANNKLVNKMVDRVVEIPMKIFGEEEVRFDPLSGKRINSTISWRLKKWLRDLEKYMERDWDQQLFGTGFGSYEYFGKVRYMIGSGNRQVYAAHNVFINILVEQGFISLFLLIFVIVSLVINSIKQEGAIKTNIYVIMALFLVAHSILRTDTGFLLYGGVIASYYFNKNVTEE